MSSPRLLLDRLHALFRRDPSGYPSSTDARAMLSDLHSTLLSTYSPTSQQRPSILCSSCLCGSKVTYRGGSSHTDPASNVAFLQQLDPAIRLLPYCPEMQWMGLPAPRDPIRLVSSDDRGEEYSVEFSNSNGTPVLPEWDGRVQEARDWLVAERVVGGILKARSPSCGVSDGRIYLWKEGAERRQIRRGSGAAAGGGVKVDPRGYAYLSADGVWVDQVVRPHLTHVGNVQSSLATEKALRSDEVFGRFLDGVILGATTPCHPPT